jgi:hypothetical protein
MLLPADPSMGYGFQNIWPKITIRDHSALLGLWEDPNLRRKMGIAGRRRAATLCKSECRS